MTGGLFDPGVATEDIPDDVTLSARVPRDLRAAVWAAREQGESTSDAIRRLLGEAVTAATSDDVRAVSRLAGRLGVILDGARVPRTDDHGMALGILPRVELLAEEVRETRDVARRALERAEGPAERAPARSIGNRPDRGTGRAEALEVVALHEADMDGLTADEVVGFLTERAAHDGSVAPQVNGVARRLTDLDQAGALAVLTDEHGAMVRRPSRRGRQCRVYTTTAIGRAWLAELATQENPTR